MEDDAEGQTVREESPPPPAGLLTPPLGFHARLTTFLVSNRGVFLVTAAQFFNSVMMLFTRILEHNPPHFHPLQILLARMCITLALCYAHMLYARIPHPFLGPPSVRGLLIIRGFCGFIGVWAMWTSMMHLSLAETTVLTFLTPSVAGYLCHVLIHERFTLMEQLASAMAFAGVVVVARPAKLWQYLLLIRPDDSTKALLSMDTGFKIGMIVNSPEPDATPLQRVVALAAGIVGVLAIACSYSLIRLIGLRAYPLHSVNYFSGTSVTMSVLILLGATVLQLGEDDSEGGDWQEWLRSMRFVMPLDAMQWAQLGLIGLCGFAMQSMLTAGLRADKSNKATMAMYTQMLFAVAFDKWAFGKVLDSWAAVGCAMILLSAIGVTLLHGQRKIEDNTNESRRDQLVAAADMEDEPREDTALLGNDNGARN